MKSPRLRLMFFPALVGLLPMPGGAIFSCPMVRDVAEHFDISDRKKVLINYWFRHIWEAAWPLYPGYVLACALADIPPSLLWRYTFPFVIISITVGWFVLLRHPVKSLPDFEGVVSEKRPIGAVLLEGLPIIIAIAGAFFFDGLAALFGLVMPNGVSFVFSFLVASLAAMAQNRMSPAEAITVFAQPKVLKLLAVILMIFIFKEIVIAARVVDELGSLVTDRSAMFALFIFLPILVGALTGVMMGFVGASFPLLMGILTQAGLYDERLCWVMLSLAAGHLGQMITPLHSCYLVTVEFFKVPFSATWRAMSLTSFAQFVLAAAYTACLYYFFNPTL